MCVPLGWRDRLSTPQVQRLRQRRPWLLRRKRDCTPPSSSHLPRVLLRRCCVLRWRKDCTSGLPPHSNGEYFGGGGTGPPPHNVGMYFGGRGTGPLPHNVSTFDVYLLAEQISAFGVNQGEVVNYGILLGHRRGKVHRCGCLCPRDLREVDCG